MGSSIPNLVIIDRNMLSSPAESWLLIISWKPFTSSRVFNDEFWHFEQSITHELTTLPEPFEIVICYCRTKSMGIAMGYSYCHQINYWFLIQVSWFFCVCTLEWRIVYIRHFQFLQQYYSLISWLTLFVWFHLIRKIYARSKVILLLYGSIPPN